MSGIHFEYMADRGYTEFVFMRQIETVQAIDQLRAIGHGHFFRMAVEDIQRHCRKDRVAQRGSLFE